MILFKLSKRNNKPSMSSMSNNGTGESPLPPLEIFIDEMVESACCLISEDGELIYGQLERALKQNRSIRLSFRNVDTVLAGFIRQSIGKLYKKFKPKKVAELLEIVDTTEHQMNYIEMVVDNVLTEPRDTRRRRKLAKAILDDPFIF